MPTLHWIGKEKVINHHLDVPYKVLEHSYGFDNGQQTNEAANSGNKIIHGDNLEALKALLPEYEGKIKCIYIDPPYNTGNEGWVYNDNVNDPKIKKWLGQVVGKEAEDLTRHDKWLCMMYPRLKLLHKLLADDGAIFISIDDNEQANLKLVCDEIFGGANFVGNYFWYKSATPPNLSHKIKKNIEYVVCYAKTCNSNKFYGIKKESKSDDPFTKPQNTYKELLFPEGIIQIKLNDQIIPKGIYGTEKFPNELLTDLIVENGKNKNAVIFKNRFIWTQEKLNEEIVNNTRISINSNSLVLSYKKQDYAREVPPNFIDVKIGVETTENAGKSLAVIFQSKVFDYPKPESLIEYLVNFLCNKNDIILDSFAGSGTTAHAVLNLNKQDGGNRKFILVEMEDYAERITAERVKRVINGYGTTEGTGGSFDYYELGAPMFLEGEGQYLNEDQLEENIRKYIYYTEAATLEGYKAKSDENPFFLGSYQHTDYYFYYSKGDTMCLDYEFLAMLRRSSPSIEQFVIYADICAVQESVLEKAKIAFKKIPRDIKKI